MRTAIRSTACSSPRRGLPISFSCRTKRCSTATGSAVSGEDLTSPQGAGLVNAGRGAHLVEEDLIPALDSGQLSAAALDVFREEPLPPGHPFWQHPRILVTPHIAGITNPRTAAPVILDNIRRFEEGRPLLNLVDPARGY